MDNTPEISLVITYSPVQAITKSFHVLEQLRNKNSVSNVLWPYSQRRSGPRKRKKTAKISSLYTKLILWQHGMTLFKLLKWYTWSNSSKVTTFPGTEPKHYLFVTLEKKERLKRSVCLQSLHSGMVCIYITRTYSSQQCWKPQKLPSDQMCSGSQPPKLPKPLPVLQDVTTAAIRKVFQEIGRLTVTS